MPKCGDKVVVHYTGWLAARRDGPPFDSSREKGHALTFTVGVGKVIAGWDEAIQQMSKGTRQRVLISSDDAYGPSGRPPTIPASADLIFDIELLDINETLVAESVRVRREEAERVEKFLRLQDEERAAEAQAPGPEQSRNGKRSRQDSESSSGDSSNSGSSSESSTERKRRKHERKERKRERKEGKHEKEKKKKHKEKHKEKHKKHSSKSGKKSHKKRSHRHTSD